MNGKEKVSTGVEQERGILPFWVSLILPLAIYSDARNQRLPGTRAKLGSEKLPCCSGRTAERPAGGMTPGPEPRLQLIATPPG